MDLVLEGSNPSFYKKIVAERINALTLKVSGIEFAVLDGSNPSYFKRNNGRGV